MIINYLFHMIIKLKPVKLISRKKLVQSGA